MGNSHDEIKKLIKASQNMFRTDFINADIVGIKQQYGIINEQSVNLTDTENYEKIDVGQDVEDEIEFETKPQKDKRQAYRISGGVIVLHGKEKKDLELTTDEKLAFQETMDEFVIEVSDLVDFNKLNVYPNNVEWSGKIIDGDLEFFFSIGEDNGVYFNGEMIKADDEFLETISKLKNYYNKFKSKWSKILASRKKTTQSD
jgi:hypothetical protein